MNKNAKLSMMARRRRKDGILESCENGYFSDKETYFEGGKAYTARAVTSGKSKIMMTAGTSVLMFPFDEIPPRRLRR